MNEVLKTVADIAQKMTECGAEISRVEESIIRVCRAYGCKRVDVYATTINIIISIEDDCQSYTVHRRIQSITTNIEKLHMLNSLVRWIVKDVPEIGALKEKFEEIEKVKKYSNKVIVFFYGFVALAFCLFFGGRSWQESVTAFVVGMAVGAASVTLEIFSVNRILIRFICSFMAASAVVFAVKVGFVDNPDYIVIGNIMSLIPGVGVTNALRDLFVGDVITGILRSIEALLLTVSIAVGFMLPTVIFGGVV